MKEKFTKKYFHWNWICTYLELTIVCEKPFYNPPWTLRFEAYDNVQKGDKYQSEVCKTVKKSNEPIQMLRDWWQVKLLYDCDLKSVYISNTYPSLTCFSQKYEYGRSGNPSRDTLETCLAAVEGAKYGLCFASGLGATTALLGMLKSGDHVITGDDIYGGTNRLFSKVASRFGIEISYVDFTDISNVQKAIKANTKVSSFCRTIGWNQEFFSVEPDLWNTYRKM